MDAATLSTAMGGSVSPARPIPDPFATLTHETPGETG